jgi:hypothetical protein
MALNDLSLDVCSSLRGISSLVHDDFTELLITLLDGQDEPGTVNIEALRFISLARTIHDDPIFDRLYDLFSKPDDYDSLLGYCTYFDHHGIFKTISALESEQDISSRINLLMTGLKQLFSLYYNDEDVVLLVSKLGAIFREVRVTDLDWAIFNGALKSLCLVADREKKITGEISLLLKSIEGEADEKKEALFKFVSCLIKIDAYKHLGFPLSVRMPKHRGMKALEMVMFYVRTEIDSDDLTELVFAFDHLLKLDSSLGLIDFLAKRFDHSLLWGIKNTIQDHGQTDIHRALSRGQILSKTWLINKLKEVDGDFKSALVLGGWYGVLVHLILKDSSFTIDQITSIDIDKSCAPVFESFNGHDPVISSRAKAVTADMFDWDYEGQKYDYVINSSCEHIQDFSSWLSKLPNGQRVVLQSNDFFDCDEHINCSKNLESFLSSTNLSKVLFSGTLELEKYNRFMVIGIV